MTKKEFWEKIDAIDVDSRDDGRYTDEEMYEIGCAFIELTNSEKREIGGWDKIVEILKPLGRDGEPMKKGDTFREWIKSRRYAREDMIHNNQMLSGKNIDDISFAEFEEKTEELKRDLYKQQVKTRDTFNTYRRTLRDEARIENIKDIISESIKDLKDLPAIGYEFPVDINGSEAVMLISDMHIGMEIDNFANKYNTEIARKRVSAYVDETIKLCRNNNVKRLNVCNLSDSIHGIIHVTGRIEETTDVIEQVMLASEILADALVRLQDAAPEVIYRSVTDNHARVMPDFKQHIEKENFSRLIDFYLEARLKDTNIVFACDNLDYDISMFQLMNGKTVICSHGHRDNVNTAVQSYVGATRQFVDYICMGHYHESKMKSFQGSKVFINGSICGNDSYATGKRLFGDPEQTLLIFDGMTLSQHIVNLKDIE